MNRCITFKVGFVSLETFHLATGRKEIYVYTAQSWTPSLQFWYYQATSAHWRWGWSYFPKRRKTTPWCDCLP